MTSRPRVASQTPRWLRGTAGIAALAMAGTLSAFTPPNPPWPNPSGYTASGPGSAAKCETFRVELTPNCTGAIWDKVFWTPSLRLERGWCNNKSITGPGGGSWSLSMWNNGCIWWRNDDPEGTVTLELTMLSSTPGVLEAAWAEYGWDTHGTLEAQSPVVWVDPAPGTWSALFQVFADAKKIPANGTATTTIAAILKDESCAPILNQTVTFTTSKGVLKVAGQEGTSVTATTGARGYAWATLVADTTPGTATVTATAMGHSASTTVEEYTCTIGVDVSPASIPANGASTSAVTLTALDLGGQPVAGTTVTLSTSLGSLGAGGVAGSSLTLTTGAGGTAVASLRASTSPGTATLQASAECGAGGAAVTFTQVELYPVSSDSLLGQQPFNTADPVNPAIGSFTFSKTLLSYPGRGLGFALTATYNSLDAGYDGPLGHGWTHSYNIFLLRDGNEVTVKLGDGHKERFTYEGTTETYTAHDCRPSFTLANGVSGGYVATLPGGGELRFDSGGRLVAVADARGNTLTLAHSTRLDSITDTSGRVITFAYSAGRLTGVSGPLAAVSFEVSAGGDLLTITDARGKPWRFTYDTFHHLLTRKDARGTTQVTNTYDASGVITQQTDAFGHATTFVRDGDTVTITPPSGHAVVQQYNAAYDLVAIRDGEGHEALLSHDLLGRPTTVTDKAGKTTPLTYDANGFLTSAVDRLGGTTSVVRNARGLPTTITDALGASGSIDYDATGNPTAVHDALGGHVTFTTNAHGQPLTITNARGGVQSLTYTSEGLAASATDAGGHTVTYTHDAAGRVTTTTLPNGAQLRQTYDAAGHVLTVTNPLGAATTTTYDANGNPVTRTFGPTGAITRFTYDAANRLAEITDALGGKTKYTYDVDGNLTRKTDPDGVAVSFTYDKRNLPRTVVAPTGQVTTYTYDANGLLTSVKNPLGQVFTRTLDAEGQVLQTTNPAGGTRSFAYDAVGRPVSVTDELGRARAMGYDAEGQLVSTTLPDGSVVTYAYDANGNRTGVTDPLGRSWHFTYNALDLLTASTDPGGHSDTFEYDALARLVKTTTRKGDVIIYEYDLGSRLKKMTLPGPTVVSVTYDAAGNPVSVTEPAGTTTMTYDLLNRKRTETGPHGATMAYAYTAAGRLASMTYPGGKQVSYAYDTAGRLATVTDWLGHQTTFQYDPLDRVVRTNLPNGTRTLYTYDTAGRLATLTHQKADGAVLASSTLTHDAAGQIRHVRRVEAVSGTPAAVDRTFTYDAANRIVTSSVDGVPTTYTFDVNGNLLTATTGGVTTTYAFDVLGRLVSVADGTHTTGYAYDASGNRLAKTYDGVQTRYLRDGGTLLATLDGAGNVQAANIWAGPILYSLDAGGAVHVHHGDERGSVLAVTDGAQAVVRAFAYEPYGLVTATAGSYETDARYVGTLGVLADENGLYYMQARYYDPKVRRFISEDPLGTAAGLNVYAYVDGDPVGRVDPSGLQQFDAELYGKVWAPIINALMEQGQSDVVANGVATNAMAEVQAGQLTIEQALAKYAGITGAPAPPVVTTPQAPSPVVKPAASVPNLVVAAQEESRVLPVNTTPRFPSSGPPTSAYTAVTRLRLKNIEMRQLMKPTLPISVEEATEYGWIKPKGMQEWVRPNRGLVPVEDAGPAPTASPTAPPGGGPTQGVRGWVKGVIANVAMQYFILRTGVTAPLSFYTGLGVGGYLTIGAAAVSAGGIGYTSGRLFSANVGLIWDEGRGELITLDQAYSDILTPWYTDRYTTHDPMVEANEWTLAYLKQIGYHDNLNQGEK